MSKVIEPVFGFPLGPEGLQKVGKFIVAWNRIEQQLDEILVEVTSLGWEAIEAIMRTPHIPARMEIFAAIFSNAVKDAALKNDGLACANAVKELSNFRNEIAHGRWRSARKEPDEEGHTPLVAVSSKQFMGTKLIEERDIAPKYEQLCRLSYRLADLWWRCAQPRDPTLFSLPSPWHDKF